MSKLLSGPIAVATLRERSRAPLVVGLVLFTALVTLGRAALEGGTGGLDGLTYVLLIALAFVVGGGLVSDELETGHAQLLLLRPITRASFFGGRLAGGVLIAAAAAGLALVAALVGGAVGRGPRTGPYLLLALPFVLVDLAAWLTVLAALSVRARGWLNIAWLAFAALVWGVARAALPYATNQSPAVTRALEAIQPLLHARDSTPIARALASGTSPDWEPLLWNLLWIAAWWTVGVLLLNQLELSRRRT